MLLGLVLPAQDVRGGELQQPVGHEGRATIVMTAANI
jgi:hypothetical protein